jgi:hypothetical protein
MTGFGVAFGIPQRSWEWWRGRLLDRPAFARGGDGKSCRRFSESNAGPATGGARKFSALPTNPPADAPSNGSIPAPASV